MRITLPTGSRWVMQLESSRDEGQVVVMHRPSALMYSHNMCRNSSGLGGGTYPINSIASNPMCMVAMKNLACGAAFGCLCLCISCMFF